MVHTTPNGSVRAYEQPERPPVSNAESAPKSAELQEAEKVGSSQADLYNKHYVHLQGLSELSVSAHEIQGMPGAAQAAATPKMSLGAPPLPASHGCSRGVSSSRRSRPSSEDADETVPLINGGLAKKALGGRQSIAPPKASYQP